jgi:3-oxoacyl-[acyl-carrier protein] reductase
MKGLMQDVPLTVDLLLRRAAQVGRDLEVVSVEPAGVDRRTWGEVAERVLRLCGAPEQQVDGQRHVLHQALHRFPPPLRGGARRRAPLYAAFVSGSLISMAMLDGRAAIVTGSARGIGRATAELLCAHGARVLINDLDGEVAEQTAAEIEGDTAVFAGDLTREGVSEALVERAVDAFGRLDIVVNNAGYTWDGMLHKMEEDQFRAMLEIHAVVPFRVLRAAAPHLREPAKREAEEGREVFRKVVNVTSVSGTQGNAGQANYSTAKSGLVGLTRTLAKEWGRFKVNVNAVAFGFVETRLTASRDAAGTFRKDDVEIPLGIPDAMRAAAPQLIPLGRPATPQDAAGAVFLLCTPWSNFIYGQVITASGGQMTGMS